MYFDLNEENLAVRQAARESAQQELLPESSKETQP